MSLDTSLLIEAKSRDERGKNAVRRMRAQGLVPVTVYGGGKEAAATSIVRREFTALLRANGRNKIYTLNFNGDSTPVKIADLQVDPVRGNLIHLDLMRISMTEKTNFEVTIKIVGESEGVKADSGVLDVVTHSLEIRCLPGDLPDGVEVDVTPLKIGDHISVKDLKISDKIEVLTDGDTVVVTVGAPRIEEEAAPAAEVAVAEPEVIKKGKTEETE